MVELVCARWLWSWFVFTGGGAGLCSLMELVCAHWWWSWSVLIGGGAGL